MTSITRILPEMYSVLSLDPGAGLYHVHSMMWNGERPASRGKTQTRQLIKEDNGRLKQLKMLLGKLLHTSDGYKPVCTKD